MNNFLFNLAKNKIKQKLILFNLYRNLYLLSEMIGIMSLAFLVPFFFWFAFDIRNLKIKMFFVLSVTIFFVCICLFFLFLIFLKKLTPRHTSLIIEKSYPELKNALISSIQLQTEYENPKSNFSKEMIAILTEATAENLSQVSIIKCLNLTQLKKIYFLLLLVGLIYISFVIITKQNSITAFTTFVSPPYIYRGEIIKLKKITGDIIIQTGAGALIEVEFLHLLEGNPIIEIKNNITKEKTKKMMIDYKFLISPIFENLSYRITYSNFSSPYFSIKVVPPPSIKNIKLTLHYPKHTGLTPTIQTERQDIEAPYGTKVLVEVEPSTPIKTGFILINDSEKIYLTLSRNPEPTSNSTSAVTPQSKIENRKSHKILSGQFTIKQNGHYRIFLIDAHNFKNEEPPFFLITCIYDKSPVLKLIKPKSDLVVPINAFINIAAESEDDYIVNKISLKYNITTQNRRGTIPIEIAPSDKITIFYDWDIRNLGIFEDDVIKYYLEAEDNNSLSGPNKTKSETLTLKITSAFENFRTIKTNQNKIIDDMKTTLSESKNIIDKFKNIEKSFITKEAKDVLWEKEKDIQRLTDKQENLESEVKKLSENLKKTFQRMQENELINLNTLSKMNEINKMMSKVLTSEMKKSIKEINETLGKLQLSGREKMELSSTEEGEKFLKSLDQMIERLKQIQLEQMLSALSKQISELTETEDKIVEQKKDLYTKGHANLSIDELYQKEKKIVSEIDPLIKEINSLSNLFKELDEKRGSKLESEIQNIKPEKILEYLNEGLYSLKKQNLAKALPDEQSALNAMKSLKNLLEETENEYTESLNKEMKNALQKLLDKALHISEFHEKIIDTSEELQSHANPQSEIEEIKKIIKMYKFILGSISKFSEEMDAISRKSVLIDPELNSLTSDIKTSIENSIQELSFNNIDASIAIAKNTLLDLNRIIIKLLEAKDRLGKTSLAAEMEEYLKRLSSLAKAQKSINELTQKLGNSGMAFSEIQKALKQLAYQQSVVRQGLSELMKDMKGISEINERLEQIEKEMQEIQNSLSKNGITNELKRKQSNVLRRLQDAGLSLRKNLFQDKRIAETGKNYAPANVPVNKKEIMQNILSPEIMQEIKTFMKEKYIKNYEDAIKIYYRRLLNIPNPQQ